MKGNSSALLRAMYIILVPVVLLIILLNSGWLQRFLPAATVHGESYNVVQYNYYYFDYYNSFLEENEDRLEELGYDPEVSDSKQFTQDGITWRAFFQQQGEANLAETAYYCDLAEEAGYSFSDEELAPIQAALDEDAQEQLLYRINAKNYYVSYYGSGMDQQRFTAELTRQVKAQAYKAHLAETQEISQEAIDQWLAENHSWDYRSVNLSVITLDALPDRGTGAIGQPQLDALATKLDKLMERYNAGVSFEELQSSFSSCSLGDKSGVLTHATEQNLPTPLADWCLHQQDALIPGDTFHYIDEETGVAYFVRLDGFSDDGAQVEAKAVLGQQAVNAQEAEALATDYTVSRNKIGMTLATG